MGFPFMSTGSGYHLTEGGVGAFRLEGNVKTGKEDDKYEERIDSNTTGER